MSVERTDGPGDETGAPGGEPLSGRLATEAALERAAMVLLWRDGVLAGLNLREVADEAGVNRGLVYHYYGSRGKLLRQALRRRGEATMSQLAAGQHLPFRERWREFFRIIVSHAEPIGLRTLLLLDGTEPIRAMPMREQTREGLQRAVDAGELDADVDLDALHTVLVTAGYGYALYREGFARELGVDVETLDGKVNDLLYGRLLDGLKPAPPPTARRTATRRAAPPS
ncbi:MAG TPA: TetR/AcrR family transcriptional regulator [Acidimicrobiales bacterium]|nr:TetR/AcrR family transcriptional regulator [Acidimicrobiales bacterium]